MGLAVVGLAATALSGLVSAGGAMMNASANAASANYNAQVAANNAKIAGQQADLATKEGQTQEQAQRMKTAGMIGAVRTGAAANGLDVNSGSPVALQSDTAKLGEMDAQQIRANAARTAWGYRTQQMNFTSQSSLDSAQASWAQSAGIIGAAGSILGGASSTGTQYLGYRTSGAMA